jgi:hypothetical protein
MGLRISVLSVTGVAVLGIAPLCAADDPPFGNDLAATIALQGMPCDKVITSKRNGDSDYAVSCKDGNHYHVYVNGQGRVIVQKLGPSPRA